MTRFTRTSFALVLCSLIGTSLAYAQAPRTWVSGVGDDVNPCSRTAPCKTFAGAISKTQAGGEISVLDNGAFGAVTITKSITINGDGTLASILASGTNAIIINGAGIKVVLRNISINGAGTVLGLNAIRFINGTSLLVDRVSVQNFSGDGIVTDTGHTTVTDSVFTQIGGIVAHSKNNSSITLDDNMIVNNNIALLADNTSTIRISRNAFYSNLAAFGCNTNIPGGGGTGTLASAGDNRKANNTGSPIPICTPTVVITVQ